MYRTAPHSYLVFYIVISAKGASFDASMKRRLKTSYIVILMDILLNFSVYLLGTGKLPMATLIDVCLFATFHPFQSPTGLGNSIPQLS